jgi:hypothetical protein
MIAPGRTRAISSTARMTRALAILGTKSEIEGGEVKSQAIRAGTPIAGTMAKWPWRAPIP